MTLNKPRKRFQALTVAAVVGLGVVGGTATMASRADAAPAAQAEDVAKDAVAYHQAFNDVWNAQNFDEIGDYYTDDSILVPPNHDIIKGRDAIVAYLKTLRPLFGELQGPFEPHSVVESGNVTAIMGNYVFKNGVRVTSIGVFEKQADGRYKAKQDMIGLRDPLR